MIYIETFLCTLMIFGLNLLSFFPSFKELQIKGYDYYYLSLRHIKGICIERPCKYYYNSLNWTIHGLWPNSFNQQHPSFCLQNMLDFNNFPISLIAKIDDLWKNLYHTNSFSFLQNQWKKHGSCVDYNRYNASASVIDQELFYMTKTIALMEQFNPDNFFPSSLIENNGLIDPHELRKVISLKFDTEFHMECKTDKKTGKKYIIKLRIPLDLDFQVIKNYKSNNTSCDS